MKTDLAYGYGENGMIAMTLEEALKVAEQCCEEYPPINPNVLVRALYTLRCSLADLGEVPVSAERILRYSEQVIVTWWASTMGFSEGIAAHGEAMDRLKAAAS